MAHLTDARLQELELLANSIRIAIIESLIEAKSGHTAGPLGMADVFTALYFQCLNHNPKDPDWEDRDRVILSNGHIVPLQYAVLARAGYFPREELKTLRKFGSRLQGHPERERLPGLETTSGPLGSGLSQAAGIAYGGRMDGKNFWTYCMMSDGEHEEGNLWEAVMFAGKNRLSNLIGIIDRNNIQIDGRVEDIMPLEPLAEKYRAFNWHVLQINGHDFEEIISAIEQAKIITTHPTVIIAHTIPGKGIPEIEYDFRWHGAPPGKGPDDKIPADQQARHFLHDLRTLQGAITSEHE